MGRKDPLSVKKGKEQREARKREQRRIADGTILVKKANDIQHIQKLIIDLASYKFNELNVKITCSKVGELEKKILNWAIDLTEKNMKSFYESCAWGWNRRKKTEEMSEEAAIYLIASDASKPEKHIGFTHFRFDMDYEDPVIYCYELQVESEGRRQGLGAHLLNILELLAEKTGINYIRLTALRHNTTAYRFFVKCGYTLDETSPEGAHYLILSKITTNTQSVGD